MPTIVGLKSIHIGDPLPRGVKDEGAATLIKAFTKTTQPFKGGVSTNFTLPSSNDFYLEGASEPFYSAYDPTTQTKELTWNITEFDDDTLEMYFGTTEPAEGALYEGEKAFMMDSKTGYSMCFARLKYVATFGGSFSSESPFQIQVTAKVQSPTQGGVAMWPIQTPAYTEDAGM